MRTIRNKTIIVLISVFLISAALTVNAGAGEEERQQPEGLVYESSLELSYANQFSVDYYEGGYKYITIADGQAFLMIPEGGQIPENTGADVSILQQPLDNIYLAATAAMDYFRQLESIDRITLSSQKANNWYIPEAKDAMEKGSMVYAGKYSAPDYELLLAKGCDAAVENTMIYHTPKVIEQLEGLGIPVIIERSSYETTPLARMEWLKFYAVLADREELAEEYFDDLEQRLSVLDSNETADKSVAFFSINTNGAVTVRKSADYIAKSIEMAGGRYVSFDESDEENALSTMTIQMETFYNTARDADILIYNSTIEGELESIDQLLGKSGLLADFKAVQEGRVWCIEKNFYQESLELGEMILDINSILKDENIQDSELYFLHRLK